ncbi:MAG: bifunctional shikimate kinase/3-dehydroquinate synthase [Actinobacteria bacterium]|nr:bifunctional shikimate kinase/3-dehydroquinate synthase [Actinomycetota bacterium]
MVSQVGALHRHIALVGFMGAGKTTLGREVARLAERSFVDTDDEIARRHGPIAQLFEERGEPEFRALEEAVVLEALASPDPAVIALGGGAVETKGVREALDRQFPVRLEVDVEAAWERVRGGERPLARDEGTFRELFARRQELYASYPGVSDADSVLLRSLAVMVAAGSLGSVAEIAGPSGTLVADEHVLGLHRPVGQWKVHTVPAGETAKDLEVVQRLWEAFELERAGTITALGGGATTDTAGFAAATFLRGVRWVAVPTTLVGQVDAAIGGKTGINLAGGKNLVGAFHLPEHVVADPDVLVTLPDRERRQGMAEVVKIGLLSGRGVWDLPEEEMIRACAAFKCAVVLGDPYEQGRRAILNLGHTFGHALEAASDFSVPHGDAVALGLLAALRLSGQPTDVVDKLLSPHPVRVDRERAWAALKRDKKSADGRTRLVLLPEPGKPEYGVDLPDGDVHAALDSLIAD